MSADQLPSWREAPAKQSIVEFVAAVTDPGSPDFVPERDRVAVFDNDGTLWTEQPVYAQLIFALDRAAELVRSLCISFRDDRRLIFHQLDLHGRPS